MVELIKNISEINAISGNEVPIRKYIIEHCNNAEVDTMGNISVFKKGKSSQKKLMIATHIDECGLIVTNITEKGFIKFECVGDVELRSLISKKVVI
ncbi:MAG: M42 family peptidase, partial [Clostridia bacterium]|nr:M42 family peptidase [Clostridia bacterium]